MFLMRLLLVTSVLAVSVLVPACSNDGPSSGTIKGVLTMTGGPVDAEDSPVAGEVELRSESGVAVTAVADENGRFVTTVPTGRYTLTGSSPAFRAPRPCASPNPVTVSEGETTVADVRCEMR